MSQSNLILDYHGPMNFAVMDSLLVNLKKNKEYSQFNKITSKRIYAMVVECLENICKHSELITDDNPVMYSHISVSLENDTILIRCGNPVTEEAKNNISGRLNHLNKSDMVGLKSMYENKFISGMELDETCAGLGFIYMAIKSANKIIYSFMPLPSGYFYFEIQLTLNK